MSKPFDIEKAQNGEHIKCPYCNRTGILCNKIQGGWLIAHEHKWTEVISEATGNSIRCEVLWDGCCNGVKVGLKHAVAEEVFEIGEEEFVI
jgi:hypothetical protein